MPWKIEAVIKAKWAPTKYEYIYSTLTYFPRPTIHLKNSFIGLMKHSNLLSELVDFS